MKLLVYKTIHLLGVMMVFLSFGGLLVRSMLGSDDKKLKKLCSITNGVGLSLLLLGGFGMQPLYGFTPWIIIKIVIWVIFGGLIAVINRKQALSAPLWWGVLVLGLIAAYLGVFKPF